MDHTNKHTHTHTHKHTHTFARKRQKNVLRVLAPHNVVLQLAKQKSNIKFISLVFFPTIYLLVFSRSLQFEDSGFYRSREVLTLNNLCATENNILINLSAWFSFLTHSQGIIFSRHMYL